MKWTTLSPTVGADIVGELESRLAAATGSNATELWVEGVGELRDPVIWARNESADRAEVRLSGIWDMASLRGGGANAASLTLIAVLCRQSERGAETLGGMLVGGTVVSASIRVGSLEAASAKPAPLPVAVPAAPQAAPLAAAPTSSPAAAVPAPAPSEPRQATPSQAAAPSTTNPNPPPFGSSGTLPKRPVAVDTSVESYPEEGDVVTHFAFGRCSVVSSDGERLRLQQERDGRVREVAMSMLRVRSPTIEDSGKRHWELSRKN